MEIGSNNMNCKNCNKLLVKKQKTFCSKVCQYLERKDKRVLPLGYKHSEKTKEKIGKSNSVALLGKHCSPSTQFQKGHFKSKNGYVFSKGKNNPAWNGGITPLYKQIRESLEYTFWRFTCLERDLFTCQDCERKGGKLQVDHIVPFFYIIKKNNITTLEQALACEELWDISNGKTLCLDCHLETPTWGGRVYRFADGEFV